MTTLSTLLSLPTAATNWSVQTGSFTATSNNGYAVNLTAASTLTLPTTPSNNDRVRIMDLGQNFNNFNLTVNAGSNTIDNSYTSVVLDINSISLELTFITGQGWIISDTGNLLNNSAVTNAGLFEMSNTINNNYTITSGNNAISAGPMTIATGVVVTVPTGSVWTIA